MNNRKTVLVAAIVGAIMAVLVQVGVAWATVPKVWNTGEVLKASDLNGNFTYLDNVVVGSHGARLVDADVSASAAIAQSKIANPGLLPKGWLVVSSICSTSSCTIAAQQPAFYWTAVARSGAGAYNAVLTTVRADATYAVVIQSLSAHVVCYLNTPASGSFTFNCETDSTQAATDAAFTILFLDDET